MTDGDASHDTSTATRRSWPGSRRGRGRTQLRESAGGTAGPGVMDLLMVYGGYEEALEQAEAYLRVPDFIPMSSSSDSEGAWLDASAFPRSAPGCES